MPSLVEPAQINPSYSFHQLFTIGRILHHSRSTKACWRDLRKFFFFFFFFFFFSFLFLFFFFFLFLFCARQLMAQPSVRRLCRNARLPSMAMPPMELYRCSMSPATPSGFRPGQASTIAAHLPTPSTISQPAKSSWCYLRSLLRSSHFGSLRNPLQMRTLVCSRVRYHQVFYLGFSRDECHGGSGDTKLR